MIENEVKLRGKNRWISNTKTTNKNANISYRMERHNTTTWKCLAEDVQTNNWKYSVERRTPIRNVKNHSEIYGFVQEQHNHKRRRKKHTTETETLSGNTKTQTPTSPFTRSSPKNVKLTKSGHLERGKHVEEIFFESPVVIL